MTSESSGEKLGRVASCIEAIEGTYQAANKIHSHLLKALANRGEVHEPGTVNEFTELENSTAFPGWTISLMNIDPMLDGCKYYNYEGERWAVFHERPGVTHYITNPLSIMFIPSEDHPFLGKEVDGSPVDAWVVGEGSVLIDGHMLSPAEIQQLHSELIELFPISE